MLFKHGHLEKKLRERGRATSAEIMSIKTEGQGSSMKAMFADDSDLTTNWFYCRLELRVTPPGEPPFETTVHTRLSTLKVRGDTVPVLYDPDDHDKVVVDYQADARAEMDRIDAMGRRNREWEARYGKVGSTDERGLGGGTGGAPLDPELQELMDLEEADRHPPAGPPSAGTDEAPAAGSQARLDRLQQLGDLRDRGVLTDAAFAQEKTRILDEF